MSSLISEPREWIIIGLTKGEIGNPYFPTNLFEIKECEAPESNRTDAGIELTRNVPRMTSGATSGAAWASFAVTWFTRAFVNWTVGFGVPLVARTPDAGLVGFANCYLFGHLLA